jgi:hypothetical protein
MLFLLIIAHDESFAPDKQLFADIDAWIATMDSQGVRRGGNPLRPAADAVTVRLRDGATICRPGPFSSAAEQICAYELIECVDAVRAMRIAASHPMAARATVEVRPVWSDIGKPA